MNPLGRQNDTSLVLDLLRALAAQTVCVGHAINLAGISSTTAPQAGVVAFFLLSGFVIAHTLSWKSRDPGYSLGSFAIERAARIYTAYLPALVLTFAFDRLGLYAVQNTDAATFAANVFMLQNYPGPWFRNFGTSGHLTTVAIEFHIYLFVGALFFLLRARGLAFALLLAVLTFRYPLFNFQPDTSGALSLFLLWLLGFGGYYVWRAHEPQRMLTVLFLGAAPSLTLIWLVTYAGREYLLSGYPLVFAAFLCLALGFKGLKVMSGERIVRFLADYSYSLFLVHFVVMHAWFAVAEQSVASTIAAVAISNLFAIAFAWAFERHYRRVAELGCLVARSDRNVGKVGLASRPKAGEVAGREVRGK